MDQDIYITEDVLKDFGISLEGEDKFSLLAHLNDSLEERIGVRIMESLSDEKLKTLLDLQEHATDDEVGKWIANEVPDLHDIADYEINNLLIELAKSREDINSAA
jgi:hypothetical protein